jgi:starch phosphorylase
MTPTPLPAPLARLPELARNLWWSWGRGAWAVFARLDPWLWRRSRHNPVRLLREIAPERLEAAARDPEYLRIYDGVLRAFERSTRPDGGWCREHHPALADSLVAYFSAEYGLHPSLPLYAGGLGILAGDHAKEASDLGVPLVGVGFMYPLGYFKQRIGPEGRQEEVYLRIDGELVAVEPALKPDGSRRVLTLDLPQRVLNVAIWKVSAGRTVLYLMDSDVEANAPEDRELTDRLYGGDREMRLRQELLLGIGGVRLVRELGLQPKVWHANEGHTALMMVERLREKLQAGLDFDRAVAEVRSNTVFTTHTPVPAGHDSFPIPTVERYLSLVEAASGGLGEGLGRVLELAAHEESWGTGFNMTRLALRLSGFRNGVSRRHGEVSRHMWQVLWPDRPEDEVPIVSITNGVHVPTWVAPEMDQLLCRRLGEDWVDRLDEPGLWLRFAEVPDAALWEARRLLKARLFRFLRDRARERWSESGSEPGQPVAFGSLFDPEALTVGFARRFATYKRAALVLRDLERFRALVADPRRPVQFLFAGKAHPADEPGKDLLHAVYRAGRVRRGLRHVRGLLPGAGGGPLAEQPHAAAGGVGDVGDEGGAERRAEPLGAGRLVDGGARRLERLGGAGERRRPGPGRARRGRAVSPARAADRAALLRARSGGAPGAMAERGAARDPDRDARVLGAPDAQGVRRPLLRSGARRRGAGLSLSKGVRTRGGS